MNTRAKTIIAILAIYALAAMLGVMCNAQSTATAENGESCNCNTKVAQFSCYPDCDFGKLGSDISRNGYPITRFAPNEGYDMDLVFYFDKNGTTDSLTYYGVGRVTFSAHSCLLFYPKTDNVALCEGYISLKIMDSRYSPHPNLYDFIPTLLKN